MKRDIIAHTEQHFPKDTAEHVVRVVLDDGDYHRHLHCAKPGTGTYHFDIVTWPGHLSISGDMGCFVFARLPDMFTFFRSEKGTVNHSYWAEKLVAAEKSGGYQKFSPELFQDAVKRRLEEFIEGEELSPAQAHTLRGEVADEVLRAAHDGEHEAIRAAMEYSPEGSGEYPFNDIYESDLTEWTYQFAWCCRAIVWALQQYDLQRRPT